MYNFGSIPFFASNNNLIEKNQSGIPSCTSAPFLIGSANPGENMRVNLGSWTNSPVSYDYNWYLDGVYVSNGSSYNITIRDINKYIRCTIVASNRNGRSRASTESTLITK